MKKLLMIILVMFTSIFFIGCEGKLKVSEEELKGRLLTEGILISKGYFIPDEITELKILNRDDVTDKQGNKIINLELQLAAYNKYFDVSGTYIISVKKHDTKGFKIIENRFESDVVETIWNKNLPAVDIDKLRDELIQAEWSDSQDTGTIYEHEERNGGIDFSTIKLNEKKNITVIATFWLQEKRDPRSPYEPPYWYKYYSLELVDDEWNVLENLGQHKAGY